MESLVLPFIGHCFLPIENHPAFFLPFSPAEDQSFVTKLWETEGNTQNKATPMLKALIFIWDTQGPHQKSLPTSGIQNRDVQ